MALPASCSPPSLRSSSRRSQRGLDLGELGRRLGGGLGVAFVGELGEDLGVVELLHLLAPRRDRRGQLGALLQNRLGAFAVVPEVRRRRLCASSSAMRASRPATSKMPPESVESFLQSRDAVVH